MKDNFSVVGFTLRVLFGKNLKRLNARKLHHWGVVFRRHKIFALVMLAIVKPIAKLESLRVRFSPRKHVLFVGQAYYNAWYLSRALRELGWKADVLNWDGNESSQIYYHGEDIKFDYGEDGYLDTQLRYFANALIEYDVFHFSNAWAMCFGFPLQSLFKTSFYENAEIELIKSLGKKIIYSNNGCQDGVTQTSFSKWGDESICAICSWKDQPSVCSDERNSKWGTMRNRFADFQCLLGGNRADFNDDPRVHEVPEFYCLDKEIWHPEISIPDKFRLPEKPKGTVTLYHAVGHKKERTSSDGINIKSSHVYLPLVDELRGEGLKLELLEPTGIPNKDMRFIQAQADIFLEMLTYGWFGANAREAMMLGKPVICYLRPEWLESAREEILEYIDELPIISATPGTVREVLLDLINNKEKREEIGRRSRAFAVKWHSKETAAKRFDNIYWKLLNGDPQLRLPK